MIPYTRCEALTVRPPMYGGLHIVVKGRKFIGRGIADLAAIALEANYTAAVSGLFVIPSTCCESLLVGPPVNGRFHIAM